MFRGKRLARHVSLMCAVAGIGVGASHPQPGVCTPTPETATTQPIAIQEQLQQILDVPEPELPPLGHYSVYLPSPKIPEVQTLYGHFPYSEAPARDLVAVGNGEKLRSTAAGYFQQMVAAAAAEGVQLVPLSGFRDRQTQHYLFYGKAWQRGQSLPQRANFSAPPGYSEHHTGYAIDIGDGTARAHDLQQSFENTAAFRWLRANAEDYGFEMSFPRRHAEVNYEPWHWRWVGDTESRQVFQAARRARS